ncbi:hypothetical protein GCM10020331_096590 [Ectobacillus funiculus]
MIIIVNCFFISYIRKKYEEAAIQHSAQKARGVPKKRLKQRYYQECLFYSINCNFFHITINIDEVVTQTRLAIKNRIIYIVFFSR